MIIAATTVNDDNGCGVRSKNRVITLTGLNIECACCQACRLYEVVAFSAREIKSSQTGTCADTSNNNSVIPCETCHVENVGVDNCSQQHTIVINRFIKARSFEVE